MNMRLFRTVVLLFALLTGGQLVAQDSGPVASASGEMNDARVLLRFGREDIVRDEIRFSEDEAAAFWPLYDHYQAELLVVNDRYADLLTNYLDAYRAGTVSAAMANQIVDDYLVIEYDILKIKQKYLQDFREALPARKAARFYQLENKMDAELKSQLALIIPLIDPV
jgi:hypothetical protein